MNGILRAFYVTLVYVVYVAGMLFASTVLTALEALVWGGVSSALLVAMFAWIALHQRRGASQPDGAADLRAPVDNTERRFGEDQHYYPAEVIDGAGQRRPALFTHHALMEAVRRARRNAEDVPA